VLCTKDLERLHALLAEAADVEDTRGALEARIRQERLHRRFEG
jgi:hypothetical protein